MKESLITIGYLLLFTGCMLAIAASTAITQGGISPAIYQQVIMTETVAAVITVTGLVVVVKNS